MARSLPLDRPAVLKQVNPLFDAATTTDRYLIHLATGPALAAAAALGVERSIAKTHLLRFYDKTGVRRRLDLIKIAA